MPTIAETLENAVRYHQRGHLQHAEQLYREILQSDPNNFIVLHSLGVLAHQMGKHDAAIELISKAIAGNQQIPQFHNTLGLIFEAIGKSKQAILAYQRAVSIKPDYAEAYHNMAVALQSQGRYAAAVQKCKQAVSLKPDYAEVYNTMAFSQEQQQQYAEAIENYKQAVQLKPDFAEAYNHLGFVLNDQGRHAEAIENYRLALQIDPDYAEVYNNLGIALKDQEQFAEAIKNFEQALQLDPDFAEAYYNLANSLRDQGRCTEALKHYTEAIHLRPDYAEAHWNMSLTLLLRGDFVQGWKEYKWRRKTNLATVLYPHHHDAPRWDGSSFADKRLFVHCEQGLGDAIQLVRYLPMVKTLGGTVIFEVWQPLLELLRAFKGIDELVELSCERKSNINFHFYASLLDLPNIFGTTLETIPNEVPYIYADCEKSERWRQRLSGPDLKVGIVWAGKSTHGNDHNRSCTLKLFSRLAKIDGVQLYSLQKGTVSLQLTELKMTIAIENLAEECEDFSDTAAVIENLELVISVDTAVAHLAGAMGKEVWTLLPFAPDWRWMLGREDSPWYPTMRLFRQPEPGCWEDVFQRVAKQLQILLDKHRIREQKTKELSRT